MHKRYALDVLQSLLVELEQDLERGADARRLDFTPETTLVTSDTVHDARYIAEMLLELLLEQLGTRQTSAQPSTV